jgi:hypothetical protein
LPNRFWPSSAVLRWVVAIAGLGALVAITYGQTLRYEFVWDDYAMLRPRSRDVLAAAWYGPWDTEIWPPYYRPLGLACYQAAFVLFGLDSHALHAVTIAGLGLVAFLVGLFVRRETQSAPLGAFAAAVYVVHPENAALGSWIALQFEILELILVVATLLIWQSVRARFSTAFWGTLPTAVLAFLTKEDAIMLLPALLVLQATRAVLVGDAARPTLGLAAALAAIAVGLFAVQAWFTGGAMLEAIPDAARLLRNLVRGPLYSLGLLWLPHVTLAGSVAAAMWIGCLAWGIRAARRQRRGPAVSLLVSGLGLLALMNLPLAIISGHTRVQLLVLGAVLAFSGAAGSALARPGRTAVRGALAFGLCLAMLVANRHMQTDYAPCSSDTLSADQDVIRWPVIPESVRQWLRDKPQRCAEGAYVALADSLDTTALTWPGPPPTAR